MKNKLIAIAVAGFGFAAIQGCSVDQGASYETEDVGVTESALNGTGTFRIDNDWGNGWCGTVRITNGLPEASAKWQVVMDLKSSVINNAWNISTTGNTGLVTMKPVNYNSTIYPGQSTEFGFCANATPGAPRPVMKAWNITTTVYADCATAGGAHPTKAALAVAMATELGTWDPMGLLRINNNQVELTQAGMDKCNAAAHKCRNLKGLLELQRDGNTSDQNVFNPTNFREDLKASFDRHRNNLNNKPAPVAHNLTLVSGPTNIGQVQNGVSKSCGPHYIYKVTKTNGANLTSTEANNLKQALCFFGQGDCGNNGYIGFTTAGLSACPSGATCVAIDPGDGDNSSTSTTSAGSAPTYPMNRVLDAIPTLLGTQCITTLGRAGTLQPKVGSAYLHCIPS